MASKSEIVRITYKELESSVQDKDRSHRYTDKSSNDEAQKKKSKRPTRGIYQPPRRSPKVLDNTGRGSQGENWDDEEIPSSAESKENSSEREIDDVSSNLKDLHLSRENFDPKKQRSKRPEIQRYVPKGRILEQQTKDDDVSESETNVDVSPRKIDLKNDQQDLKVTVVVNEGASSPAQPSVGAKPEPKLPPNPHNPLDRTTKGESPKRLQSKTDTGNQSRGGQSGPQSNKPRHQRDSENKPKSGGRNSEEKRFGGGEAAQKRGPQHSGHSGPGQGKQYDRGSRDNEFRRGESKRGDLVEGEITREVAGRRKNLNLKDSLERGETGWQRVVGVTRRKRTVLKGSKA